ncbi:MAG: hypothetical protein RBU37_22985 [Myxococcota bacterium]|jgi:hypothetical protein|nr:hypothetical protein [Myxococcota bacterium]
MSSPSTEHVTHDEQALAVVPAQRFRLFTTLNDHPQIAKIGECIDRRMMRYVSPGTMIAKLVAALAESRALPLKEVIESFEFVQCVRKWVRAPQLADLCCGHGLVGLLFAALERNVEQVILLDQLRPPNHTLCLDAVAAAAPWVREKLQYVQAPLASALEYLAPGCSVVAVHACGARTDKVLELAIHHQSALAVMPCCYRKASNRAPLCLQERLGPALSADIHRSYQLEAAGYRVSWSAISPDITPMNRILRARAPLSTPTPLPRRSARND